MKKGCIVTLTDNNNFGNRLQNFALQKYLERNNIECDTLWLKNEPNLIKRIIKSLILIITTPFYRKNRERLLKQKRKKHISEFTDKYIRCKQILSEKELEKIENNYDIFVFGSDQIWSPYAVENMEIVLGKYIKQTKKISYAASLGVDRLDNKLCEKLSNSLQSFDKITVREDKGKEILEKLISEKEIDVVVDPTMLITNEEWKKISKKPKNLRNEKYILTYFLGELSSKRKKEIERIATENDCKVINVLDKESDFYIIDPGEFVYLEENAFLICTDSFHSCVFAILFNRPFLVFDREDNNADMSSRIETLINKFELKDRIFTDKITDKNLKCDYTKVNKILEQERKKSKEIIEKALE